MSAFYKVYKRSKRKWKTASGAWRDVAARERPTGVKSTAHTRTHWVYLIRQSRAQMVRRGR